MGEALAKSVVANSLEWSDHGTRPVEWVAALSAATGLGSDIMRARDYDGYALRRAVLVLARAIRREGAKSRLPMSQMQSQRFAIAVLFEVTNPNCRTCGGAGVVVVGDLKVTCSTCEGIAVHRYNDSERAKMCGIARSEWPTWERRYGMALRVAREHEASVGRVRGKLGV